MTSFDGGASEAKGARIGSVWKKFKESIQVMC